MKKIFLFIIKLYQRFISPLKPTCCRFYPSCSAYSYTAISRYGAIRGGYLAIKRILRCNPYFRGGYDPVPDDF